MNMPTEPSKHKFNVISIGGPTCSSPRNSLIHSSRALLVVEWPGIIVVEAVILVRPRNLRVEAMADVFGVVALVANAIDSYQGRAGGGAEALRRAVELLVLCSKLKDATDLQIVMLHLRNRPQLFFNHARVIVQSLAVEYRLPLLLNDSLDEARKEDFVDPADVLVGEEHDPVHEHLLTWRIVVERRAMVTPRVVHTIDGGMKVQRQLAYIRERLERVIFSRVADSIWRTVVGRKGWKFGIEKVDVFFRFEGKLEAT